MSSLPNTTLPVHFSVAGVRKEHPKQTNVRLVGKLVLRFGM